MLQISTHTKAAFLAAFASLYNGGIIRVYSGVQPATADHAETGTYLGSITKDGLPPSMGSPAGLTFVQSGPYIVNNTLERWALNVEHTGIANWFRVVGPGEDDGSLAYDLPRIDGGIATDNSLQMQLPALAVTAGDLVSPISFFFTIPPIIGA